MDEVRNLASGASRDVGNVEARLRAHTKSLEALRETQLEQSTQILRVHSEMRQGFAVMEARFHRLDGDMREGFAQVGKRFDQVDKRFEQVDVRFDRVEGQLREGFATLSEGIAKINARLDVGGQPGKSEK